VLSRGVACLAGEPTFLFYSEKKSSKRKRRPLSKRSAGQRDSSTLLTHRSSLLGGAGFMPISYYNCATVHCEQANYYYAVASLGLRPKKAPLSAEPDCVRLRSFESAGVMFLSSQRCYWLHFVSNVCHAEARSISTRVGSLRGTKHCLGALAVPWQSRDMRAVARCECLHPPAPFACAHGQR
jgi:hypothetical protein